MKKRKILTALLTTVISSAGWSDLIMKDSAQVDINKKRINSSHIIDTSKSVQSLIERADFQKRSHQICLEQVANSASELESVALSGFCLGKIYGNAESEALSGEDSMRKIFSLESKLKPIDFGQKAIEYGILSTSSKVEQIEICEESYSYFVEEYFDHQPSIYTAATYHMGCISKVLEGKFNQLIDNNN